MYGRIIVTFDKDDSGNDIATLISFRKNGSSMTTLNVITGSRAIDIWNELNGKDLFEERKEETDYEETL